MKKIFYIHGLGSTGNSSTPKNLKKYLGEGYAVYSCDIPFRPFEAVKLLKQKFSDTKFDCVIGSSLGGFYASLGEEVYRGVPLRILVNPALHAAVDIRDRIGLITQDYSGPRENGEISFTVDNGYLRELQDVEDNVRKITDSDRLTTYGFFGDNDTLLDEKDEFKRLYIGNNFEMADHFNMIRSEHKLAESAVRDVIAPFIKERLGK